MSKDTHRLSQYLPTAEMPQGKEDPEPRIVARGKDSTLIRDDDGLLQVADSRGRRRT